MARSQENDLRKRALALAESCHFEKGHSLQVARLSLSFFDQLVPLHGLGEAERGLLEAAAILHDIGWMCGQKGHHKISQEIIIHSRKLSLPKKQRVMIGLLARYHRKSLPKKSHRYFSDLDEASKSIVAKLASLLRLADGLDRTHRSNIEDLICKVTPRQFRVDVRTKEEALEDIEACREKSDLFRKVFKKEVRVSGRLGVTADQGHAS